MKKKEILKNKKMIQSYLLTTAKYDFSVYEKRIIYRIIEMLQSRLDGVELRGKIQKDIEENRLITMPISLLLKGEDDKNHSQVKKALLSLNNKQLFYDDGDIWKPIRVVEMPKIRRRGEFISFTIHKEIYEVFLDFSKGFSKFELKTAMSFESIYAMRFHELLYNQQTPIDYSIEKLREYFNLENKYKLFGNFRQKVIEVAKKELDKKSSRSFDYKTIKNGRKVTKIRFYPKVISDNLDELGVERKEVLKEVSIHYLIDEKILKYLKYNLQFTDMGIKNNYNLFKDLSPYDFFSLIESIQKDLHQAKNKEGYLISCLKNRK